ncbi:ABC transporter substrate-binding protein [Actinocorallia longicatena]|uniref:ABC transporter substrate-binding protein n=1 Tax=Actinocorallia longicatena TaxID=111803 RepID=A0ABP6QHP2_9ACTN
MVTALAFTSAACGGDDDKKGKSANGLEKTTLTVGAMPVTDDAPLQIAVQKGLFKAEGLDVKLETIAGGADAIPKLKGGALDISFGNFVSFLGASSKGVLDVRFVAEGFQSAPGTHAVLVPKDSPITSVKDLVGKKIAVNTKRNISTLLIRATLEPSGISLDDDKNFVEMPFPAMEAAIKAKSVDAVQAVEPFVTQLQQSVGARVLTDLSQGPTADFPIAGYATSAAFAEKNPKTVAAFQRALAKGQAMAADKQVVQAVLPSYTKITTEVAATLSYGAFPTTLSATRLQRVADVMQQYGYLTTKIDVKSLLISGTS